MNKRFVMVSLMLAAMLAVGACGKKGEPESPDRAASGKSDSAYPRH